MLHPTAELVAVSWVRGLTGIPAGGVATTVPDDDRWPNGQFVQVTSVGGRSDIDVPLLSPALGISCWAVNPNGQRPPWNKAAQLAEAIRAGCYATAHTHPDVPAGYATARVLTAYLITEPRRITSEATSYARYDFDLTVNWVELATA